MIIFRKGDKNMWEYVDGKGRKIEDQEILDYIKKLVIPPNYKDVKIFYERKGEPKILYQGYDTKDRLQRIYSPAWNKKAIRKKFCELLNFSEQIQKIKSTVKTEMESEHLTKSKCISMIIRIMMVCYFRIGNKRYQELYGSFGAMNIQKQHVKFKNDDKGTEYMYMSFVGKKGVLNTCSIYDKELIKEMKKIIKFREDDEMIFQWLDSGVKIPIKAIDINFWLKNFDPVITSKDFRTYDSNIFLIIHLRGLRDASKLSLNARKKNIVKAMKIISEKIHNTPAVLKKNYTQGGIVNLYINEPEKFKRYFINEKTPRIAFSDYLKDYCKTYTDVKKEIVKMGGKGIKL